MNLDITHLRYDHYLERGATLRRLRSDVDMLLTALQALERGKSHVVKDHVARVADSLREEIARLQALQR